MALKIKRTSQIPTNKCYFHKDKDIISFCCENQCTLPMCEQCKPIHIQQHQSHDKNNKLKPFPNIISYEEAYLTAYKQLTLVLENNALQRQNNLQRLKVMKASCETAISNIFKGLQEQMRGYYKTLCNLENTVNKLERGSIKTLIFYYAGQLALKYNITFLDKKDNFFDPVLVKINQIVNEFQQNLRKCQIEKVSQKTSKITERQKKLSPSEMEPSYSNLGIYSKNPRELSYHKNNISEQQNQSKRQTQRFNYQVQANYQTFNNEDKQCYLNLANPAVSIEYKKEESKQKIYDQQLQSKQISEIRAKYMGHNHSVKQLKTLQQKNLNIEDRNQSLQRKISFAGFSDNSSKQIQKIQPLRIHYNQGGERYDENPLTFERRFQKQEDLRKYDKYGNFTIEESQKPLLPSDLEDNTQYHGHRNTRSVTQSFPTKKIEKIDINKQVLSPEQIKIMLEQRMAERSRILASRKSTTPDKMKRLATHTNRVESVSRQGQRMQSMQNERWAKDSIINQIYQSNDQRF